jgi:hypothetical protein
MTRAGNWPTAPVSRGMMMRLPSSVRALTGALLLLSMTAVASAAAARQAPAAVPACDRECLRGMVSSYLYALVRHDMSGLPVAANLRVTEDSEEKALDKVGIVRSVTRLRGYRQDFIDERTGIVGAHVVVEESGAPVLLVVRLKVVGEQITEIETVTTRSRVDGSIFNIDGVGVPSEAMSKVPKLSQLPTREEAIRIALTYPAGLDAGSFVKSGTPFTETAFRLENGTVMAGPACTRDAECRNIKTQPVNNPLRGKIDIRVVGVDERMGVAWLRMEWGTRDNKKLAVWEAFKIYDGQVHVVEAFMKVIPQGTGSGWPNTQ